MQDESFRLLEEAPAATVVVRGEVHTVVYANASFCTLSGIPAEAMAGRNIAEVLGSPDAELLRAPPVGLIALLDRVRAHGGVVRDVDVSGRSDDESAAQDVWRCTAWPVHDGKAALDQLVVELEHAQEGERSLLRQRDIAERMLVSALREQALSAENERLYGLAEEARALAEDAQSRAEAAQREAEAANGAKSQFLASMSHELRTPLNAIGGYAQLMEMGLRGPVTDAQVTDLGRIKHSQAHLLGLINAVLNYAKLEAGHVVYSTTRVALDDALTEAESLVGPQLRAKGLRYRHVRHEVSDGGPVMISADAEKLRQILVNLLTNAIKFTPPDGQITVGWRVADGKALVSVSDTGRGIPAEKLQSIFDPFVQVGRHLNSTDSGIGLGLAISRDLAVGMDGDLSVESVEGAGSTFTLTLSLAV